MLDPNDFLPQPPWKGPPIPRGFMYWIRVRDKYTGETLHEYHSVFTDMDEATEDVYRMIGEGRIPYMYLGYIVEMFDTHPDVPGSKMIDRRYL